MTVLSKADADPAPMGHNNPPEITIRERLEEVYSAELAKVQPLAEKANAAPQEIASDEQLLAVGEIVIAARDMSRSFDTLRETEKRPFLTAGRDVDAYFKTPIERLKKISDVLTKRADAWQRKKAEAERRARAEAERKAREEEEAARKAAEAAQDSWDDDEAQAQADRAAEAAARAEEIAAAPVSTADATRIRSDSGTLATTKTELTFEVEDYAAVDLVKLRPYFSPAEIDKAVRAYLKIAKGSARLAGVRFYEKETAQFRR
jgi:hypothetical protein